MSTLPIAVGGPLTSDAGRASLGVEDAKYVAEKEGGMRKRRVDPLATEGGRRKRRVGPLATGHVANALEGLPPASSLATTPAGAAAVVTALASGIPAEWERSTHPRNREREGDATPSRPLPSTTRSEERDPTPRQIMHPRGDVSDEEVPEPAANPRRIEQFVRKLKVKQLGRVDTERMTRRQAIGAPCLEVNDLDDFLDGARR